jgi:hypothetical protein
VLPKYDTGTVWEAGSTVETMTSFRAIHGGGYQFRLCPLASNLTEACFQETPMAFVGNSKLMISDGSTIELDSVDVTNGTLPVGGAWRMLGIPDAGGAATPGGWAFKPPCYEPGYPAHPPKFPNQGNCTGDWTHNVTMYDYLRVPEHLKPGEYVLGFRWDCETSAQVNFTRKLNALAAAFCLITCNTEGHVDLDLAGVFLCSECAHCCTCVGLAVLCRREDHGGAVEYRKNQTQNQNQNQVYYWNEQTD